MYLNYKNLSMATIFILFYVLNPNWYFKPSFGNMKAKIIKVNGYKKEGVEEYFQVTDENMMTRWEAFDNLDCYDLINSFFDKISFKIESLAEADGNRKAKFMSAIKKINERKKLLEETYASVTKKVHSYKHTFEPSQSTVPNKQLFDIGSSSFVKDGVTAIKDLDYGENKVIQILPGSLDNKDYAQTRLAPKPVVIKNDIFIRSLNYDIASFSSKSIFGDPIVHHTFDMEKVLFFNSRFIMHYLILGLNGEFKSNNGISASGLSLNNNADIFIHLTEKIRKNKICLGSTEDERHFYFFYLNHENEKLQKYDLFLKYYILKIDKNNFFGLNNAINMIKERPIEIDYWHETDIRYQMYYADQFEFMGKNFFLPKGKNFVFAGDSISLINKIFIQVLKLSGKHRVEPNFPDVNFVIVSEETIQFIHRISWIKSLIMSKCSFYKFQLASLKDECKGFSVTKIFGKNVVFTMTKKFIEKFDLKTFYKTYKNYSTSITLRIPPSLLKVFKKQYSDEAENTITKAVYKILKESVEEYNCPDILSYKTYIRRKYCMNYRYVCVLDDITSAPDIISFNDFTKILREFDISA